MKFHKAIIGRQRIAVFAISLVCSASVLPFRLAIADPAPAAASSASTEGAAEAADQPQNIETIIVTAQKREERVIDVPASVTSLDAAALAAGGDTRLLDFADQVPGLSLTSTKVG